MKWVLTIVILSNFGTCFSDSSSDLAHHVFLYSEAAGSLANIAYMYEIRTRKLEFEDAYNIGAIMKIYPLALQGSTAAAWLIDAWAWVFFAINTSLTASIMAKIMCAICRIYFSHRLMLSLLTAQQQNTQQSWKTRAEVTQYTAPLFARSSSPLSSHGWHCSFIRSRARTLTRSTRALTRAT
jgi:hypothetical protein